MNNINNKILGSLLFPFYGVIDFFKYRTNGKFSYPLLVFFVFFGVLFVVPEVGDASRHFESFQSFKSMKFEQFTEEVIDILLLRSTSYSDFYLIFSNFLISRISDSSATYFGFHAIIYGFVFILLFKLLFRNFYFKNDWITSLTFLLLFLIFSIAKIQYVRFYLAVLLFLYGVYSYILENKKFFWVNFILASLVHISLFIPSTLFVVFFLLRKRLMFWFMVSIIAFFSSNNLTHYSENILNLSNEFVYESNVETMTKAYIGNEEYILQRANRFEERRWFTKYNIYLINALAVASVAFFLLLKFGKFRLKDDLNVLFTFSLFFFSLFQFGSVFASIGERFGLIFIFSNVYFLIKVYPTLPNNIQRFFYLPLTPFFLLYVMMSLREIISVANIFTVIGSSVTLPFALQEPISIYDFIFN